MKKYLFIVLLIGVGFGQYSPIDFETGGHGSTWTRTIFENDSN